MGFLGGRGWHCQGGSGAMRPGCPWACVPVTPFLAPCCSSDARISGHLAPRLHLLLKTKYLLGIEAHGDKRVEMERNLELGGRALASSCFQQFSQHRCKNPVQCG